MSLFCVVANAASTPSIESATYNALTGEVVITGTALNTNQPFDVSVLTFSGENGESYRLQGVNDPSPSSSTSVSFTLSNTDHLSLSRILNKDGTSPVNGSPYNVSVAANFNGSATADPSATLVVSNFRSPTLISATYNASTGVLHFTGEGFRATEGANNDVTASKISIVGEGGNSSAYQLSKTQSVDVISVTEFSLPLHVDDNLYVYSLLNKDGSSADDDTTFYFSVSDDWMSGGNSAENLAQRGGLAGNTVTVSAADNQASGTLVVSGVNNAGYFVPLSSVSGNYGIYSIDASGQWTYQINTSAVPGLAAGTSAIDTFNVTGNDNAVYKVIVTITGQNDAPVAANDTASTNEDTPLQNINVLANDSDVDGDSLSVSGTPAANSGVVAVNGDNTLTYTPNANFTGTDTVTYIITDGNLTDTATVTVTVTAVNDAPVASNDTASTNEDTPLQNINVLANDTDVDGDSLAISGTPSANSGVVVINGDNTLTYTPNSNFTGTDTFAYIITDGNLTDTATVTVTVTAVNDAPVASNDTASTNEDTPLQNINVLANDSDVDGDSLAISGTPSANSGVVAVNGETTLTYTPDANFNGTDTITYTITDGNLTDTATVTVTVTAVNDAPVATNDTASTNEDTQLQNINVMVNDSDVDGDSLSVSGTPSANSGVVAINGDQTLTYTPNPNFTGTDTITYIITDGNLTDTATVTVTVTAVNDAPVASNDSASTNEDTPLQNINVLANDSDVDGDNLSISGTPTANSGVVTVNGDNTLDYTPDANFNGTDTITYTVTDGNLTDTATVTVTVTAINDTPVAANDTASTNEDTQLQNINVLANDSDVDGDNLSVSGTPTANSGVVIVNGNGTLTYTPGANYNGTDTITYTITDGTDTNTASVTVTVTAVNDVPVANGDTASTNEDTLLNINVLANDSDVDNDSLSVSGTPTANSGVVSVKPDNTLDYTPKVNFNGMDTISYTITDGNLTDTASVTVTVNAVNDTPTYVDLSGSIAENSPNGTTVMTMTGTDVDTGDTLTYSIQTNSGSIFAIDSATGAITVGDNSSLNYESATQHQIVVKVTDTNGATATANGTITVTNVEENVTPTIATSFGNAGTGSASSFAADDYNSATETLIDASGRIIVSSSTTFAGSSADIGLSRFNSDGTLDRSFGSGGAINKDLGGQEQANAIALDASGNILVAGTSTNTQGSINSQGFIARYTSGGQLDTSFNSTGYRLLNDIDNLNITDMVLDSAGNIYLSGTGTICLSGTTVTQFTLVKVAADAASHEFITPDFSGLSNAYSTIELQSDGKVLLIGTATTDSNGNDFAVARFNVTPSLSLDTTYGSNGLVLLDLGSGLNDLASASHMLSSDELIVTGSSIISADDANAGFAGVKLDASGGLVNSFATAGILRLAATTFSANSALGKRVIDDDSGNLLFAVDVQKSSTETVIYKTNSAGAAATAFASNGILNPGTTEMAADIDIDIDTQGRLLLTASKGILIEPKIFLARYSSTGTLDTSFSGDGSRFFGPTFVNDALSEMIGLTVSPHAGKYLLVGSSTTNGLSACIITRFNSDGSVDTTFGEDGYFVLSAVESVIACTDVAEYSDGSLIAVGSYDATPLVIKLTSSGQLDTTFDSDGKKLISFGSEVQFKSIAIDANNSIVLAGQSPSPSSDGILARINIAGALDNTFSDDGMAQIDLGSNEDFRDIRILSDNSILVVGQIGNEALVAKFLHNGSLDTAGFAASNGYTNIDLDSATNTNVDILNKLLIRSDGRIVAAGSSTDGTSRTTLIQLTSDGALDTSFSSDGIATITPGSGSSEALDIVFDASERPVIVGKGSNGSDDDIFISRLTQIGDIDSLFNTTGRILFDYGSNESANTILINSDGSLVIAGSDNLNLFPTSFFFIQKIQLVEP